MISRIGHLALRVRDLDRSAAFARDVLGLRETERYEGVAYLTCNGRHHELVLIDGGGPTLDHVALEVAAPDHLDELRDRLEARGVSVISQGADEPGISDAVRFYGPQGHMFEVVVGTAHDQSASYDTVGVRPLRLDHVTLNTDDVTATERFLVDVIGLRVSDRMKKSMSWLRCNAQHHAIGLVRNPAGLHHYAFEVDGWDAFRRLGDHLTRLDREIIWGPGRHTIGNNLYSYFFDADGSVVEYTGDAIRIDNEASYPTGDWPDEPRSIAKWGPLPPHDFLSHGIGLRASTLTR